MSDVKQKKNDDGEKMLSVVVPVYNEEEVLPEFHRRLVKVLGELEMNSEIVYVNDGSVDGSVDLILQLKSEDDCVALVDLSRNFGKEIAMTAGMDHAQGTAVVVIDADLQDPPELIPEMIEHWQAGYDVVYAQRTSRVGEPAFKKVTAHIFYRVIQKLSRVTIPPDAGDFRLLSRRAVEALSGLREQHRFMKGLFSWIGYPQKAIQYERDVRYGGKTKWGYIGLWNFAIEGITSFSTIPLKIATYLGVITAFGAFVFGMFMVVKTIFYGNPVPGYPSLLVVVLFLGGIQLIALGVIGEYLGRMFDETKRRPLYFIKDYKPSVSGEN